MWSTHWQREQNFMSTLRRLNSASAKSFQLTDRCHPLAEVSTAIRATTWLLILRLVDPSAVQVLIPEYLSFCEVVVASSQRLMGTELKPEVSLRQDAIRKFVRLAANFNADVGVGAFFLSSSRRVRCPSVFYALHRAIRHEITRQLSGWVGGE
jgi:hypothetical protein